jgi:hypothetical protein
MHLRSFSCKIFLVVLFSFLGLVSFAQEDDEYWKKLLNEEVEVENPVYKPVISLGAGVLGFFGDIKNPGSNILSGRNAFKINVSTLVGKNNAYKLNFYVLVGSLSGQDFNISRTMQMAPLPLDDLGDPIYPNSSFLTEIYQFGINFEYGFYHLIKTPKQFRPFVSIGIAPIIFSPKGDLTYGGGATPGYYHFWSDGTIRSFPQNGPDAWKAKIVKMEGNYETDLSSADLYGVGKYSQNSLAFPVEVGFDFYLSYRVNLRIATSVNYALTSMLDNYDSRVAKKYGLKAKSSGDVFTFTYFTMNFDLFSEAKTIMIEKAFADLDNYDYEVLLADQDNDQILDLADKCPDTPNGVAVDSTGCPFDTDKDGVLDYMDQEENTAAGATVDDKGVQLSSEKLAEMFNPTKNVVNRKEIKVIPVAKIWTRNITFTPGVIPDKFKSVDADGDGYISFQELLKTIDDYFDEQVSLKPEDIYELNEFFFSQ